MSWLKLHDDFVNDPKMRRYFSKSERCDWLNLLCLANKSTERGVILLPNDEISYALELADEEWIALRSKFTERGMAATREDDGALIILNWERRQYEKQSDTPQATRDRKRAQRDREKTQEEERDATDDARDNSDHSVTENNVTPTSRDVTPCHATDKTRQEEDKDKTPKPPTTGVRTQPAQSGRSLSQGKGGAPESKRDREAFISATLKEHPHWRKEYERVLEDADPLEPDRYGAGVLRRWIDGDGTPPDPPGKGLDYYPPPPPGAIPLSAWSARTRDTNFGTSAKASLPS